MPSGLPVTLDHVVRSFERRANLDQADREAFLALPFKCKTVEAGRYLVREGVSLVESSLLVAGYTARQKETADGGRQILSIHIPGDFSISKGRC